MQENNSYAEGVQTDVDKTEHVGTKFRPTNEAGIPNQLGTTIEARDASGGGGADGRRDGVIMERGGRGYVPMSGFDDIVQAYDVSGMEVYRSPVETPPQYGGLTACGVILLWTKGGRHGG